MTLRKYQLSRNKDSQVKHTDGFRLVRGSSGESECEHCFLPVPYTGMNETAGLYFAQNDQWVGPFGLARSSTTLGGGGSNPSHWRVSRITDGEGGFLPLYYFPMFE